MHGRISCRPMTFNKTSVDTPVSSEHSQFLKQLSRILSNSAANAQDTEWARIPGAGCRLEGFCRAELYSLLREGKIRSKNLCKPGKERGIRLIHVPSLRHYIEAHEGEPTPVSKSKEAGEPKVSTP